MLKFKSGLIFFYYAVYAKNAPGAKIQNIILKNIEVKKAKIPRYYKEVDEIIFDDNSNFMVENELLFSYIII